jgi:ribonuclease I
MFSPFQHGTCSGLDQRTYLTQAMNIEISSPTPSVISSNVGGSVALSDLRSAFRMSRCGAGSDCWTGLSCSGSGDGQQLTGITTCWSTSFEQIICPAMSLSGQQCSSSQINIPSF